jgi:desulfoferrodoxin (superoxide reductase-like protein)
MKNTKVTVGQMQHPDDTQPTVEAWNEAVKQRKIFIFEHRVKRKDGQWRNSPSVQFHF